MRNQKGVSLITLIITIIVVIIIAAIALRGVMDAPSQAQFSGFAKEMGELDEAVDVAMTTAKGEQVQAGNSRSDAQLYNYIARGGKHAVTAETNWLVRSDAAAIPCTLIDETNAAKVLGDALPTRNVETYVGTNQKVSYFVTPKGEVFCWPPFVYDGKSYINEDVTVTYTGDDEMDATNPTQNPTVTLTFPRTSETVIVSNTADNNGVQATRTAVFNGQPAIFYGTSSTTATGRGVASGITFENYKSADGEWNVGGGSGD